MRNANEILEAPTRMQCGDVGACGRAMQVRTQVHASNCDTTWNGVLRCSLDVAEVDANSVCECSPSCFFGEGRAAGEYSGTVQNPWWIGKTLLARCCGDHLRRNPSASLCRA